MSSPKNYDPDQAAKLIKVAAVARGVKQTELAERLGLNRVVLNMFLNRHLDLRQPDIEAILDELGIRKQAEKMCRAE